MKGSVKMNNQELVNKNMEELFDLPRTVESTRSNIVRVDKDTMPLENNQNISEEAKPKKKGRGGPRPNSGRKLGSTNKLSATDILAEIARQDKPFAEGLAEDYVRARQSGDMQLVQRYQQMFLNKVIADKQEMDVTSNGHTVGASFVFPTNELPEWQDDKPTTH